MKTTLKKLAGTLLFFSLLLLLLGAASAVFVPKDNSEKAGMEQVAANGILAEEENSIDLLMIGDSESHSAFTPMQMWKEQGIAAYVCGTSGQPMHLSLRFLEQALERQHPMVVVLETNTIFREYGYDEYLFSRLQKMFPVFQYHNRWKAMYWHDFGGRIAYTWKEDFKGYNFSVETNASDTQKHMNPSWKFQTMSRKNRMVLDRMHEICREHGAALVLVSTPSTINWNYAKHNTVALYAKERGIAYLDLNMADDFKCIDWKTDTRDKGDHLNYYGAVKVSSYLAGRLKQEYGLPDHRGDAAYRSWDQAFERYREVIEQATGKPVE